MFVTKQNKLYIRKEDKVVGVNFSPLSLDFTDVVEDFDDTFEPLEPFEVRAKFNITDETPYVFPIETETSSEETLDETTEDVVDEVVEEIVETSEIVEEVVEAKKERKPRNSNK